MGRITVISEVYIKSQPCYILLLFSLFLSLLNLFFVLLRLEILQHNALRTCPSVYFFNLSSLATLHLQHCPFKAISNTTTFGIEFSPPLHHIGPTIYSSPSSHLFLVPVPYPVFQVKVTEENASVTVILITHDIIPLFFSSRFHLLVLFFHLDSRMRAITVIQHSTNILISK